jgi:hypothetical protein
MFQGLRRLRNMGEKGALFFEQRNGGAREWPDICTAEIWRTQRWGWGVSERRSRSKRRRKSGGI